MVIHFPTRAAAISHLMDNGWKQIANGNYVSRDGSCAASVHPCFDEVVAISIREIE